MKIIIKFFNSIRRTIITLLGGCNKVHYPTSFQAVDIIVIDPLKRKVLMGYKWNKSLKCPDSSLRFIGGFVDPTDYSLERAALRELREEAGGTIRVENLKYIGSMRIDDPRYRESSDKIMSAVFVAKFIEGEIEAGDDIAKVEWIDTIWLRKNYVQLNENMVPRVVKEHQDIVDFLSDHGFI